MGFVTGDLGGGAPELSGTCLAAALHPHCSKYGSTCEPEFLGNVAQCRRTRPSFGNPGGNAPMSERPMLVINRVLDGLEGKFTNATWARFGAIE